MKKKSEKEKQKNLKEKITKEMSFFEVLNKYPETAKIFLKYNLTCISCPLAQQETIEEGCLAHGIDSATLIKELNLVVNKNSRKK